MAGIAADVLKGVRKLPLYCAITISPKRFVPAALFPNLFAGVTYRGKK